MVPVVVVHMPIQKHRDSPDTGRFLLQEPPQSVATVNLVEVLRRQFWLIVFCTVLGCVAGWQYVEKTPVWYETRATVLVSQRNSGLAGAAGAGSVAAGESVISEEILANHMALLHSRRNIENALQKAGLSELDSIVSELDDDQDVTDYVIDNLSLSRGGKGDSRAARSLDLEFQHTHAADAQRILQSVVDEYMAVVDQQFADSLAIANNLVIKDQDRIQKDLQQAQEELHQARRAAPVLFTGQGSSNVYVEQYRVLANQLVTAELDEVTIKGRLEKANRVAKQYEDLSMNMPIEALGVIDTESLERLGVFAGMKANSTRIADIQMNQPERQEEARAQYTHLLRLMSEKKRLEADFGSGHPDVQKLQGEIDLVEEFLEDHQVKEEVQEDEPQLTSRQLLDAYIGFLKSEIQANAERKAELTARVENAEKRARSLVDFEMQDEILRSRIDRNQQLFDGLVEQLRTLNLASGVDGYIHEILEEPRLGIKIWPRLSICGAAGFLLGLISGLFLALINDQRNAKFHSAQELDNALGMPVLGYVDRLPVGNTQGLVASDAIQGEAFRMLRAMLLSDVREGRLSTLTATSPAPGDGKSTILMNVAATFASLGMPVVIVEADMRRPTFRKRMKLNNEFGLSEILGGSCLMEDAMTIGVAPNLSVIHAGAPTASPAELLESEAFDALLKELRTQFVLTIVDVGPVLAVSDSLSVAQKVDGTILVVRPSADTRSQISGAAEMLRAGGVNLLGMVVNAYGSSKQFQSGHYGYGDSYGSSYGQVRTREVQTVSHG